jgi:hypothetical protein
MARRWTIDEENKYYSELTRLYVVENRSIREISHILNIGESTVYDRLVRLNIPSLRTKKKRYNNIRGDIIIPRHYSSDLAEFIGILLGDGHLTPTQVTVTLGKKERGYVEYVRLLIQRIFHGWPKLILLKNGNYVLYLGSTVVVQWLLSMGLVHNKVHDQVNLPSWIFSDRSFLRMAVKGLIDTDGSVYKLSYGIQISFCNHSIPLLHSMRKALIKLGFHPSRISGSHIYLTRMSEIEKFVREIGFSNQKHLQRYFEYKQ